VIDPFEAGREQFYAVESILNSVFLNCVVVGFVAQALKVLELFPSEPSSLTKGLDVRALLPF
jgi:hypothetical protein